MRNHAQTTRRSCEVVVQTKFRMCVPCTKFHSLSVPSLLTESAIIPVGCMLKSWMVSLCPPKICTHCQSYTLQMHKLKS